MASPGGLSLSTAQRRPVYQIDFTAVASGKRIASTKRRVRWRFGFANSEALAAGETGTACRGEEHDVTLVWSITSGKRLVLADGQEIHFSSSRSAIFDYSWTMRGNHVLKIVAHASPPLSQTPGFRQYDFFVDGQSFFSFPKLYRLGLSANDSRATSPSSPTQLAERGQRYSSYSSTRLSGSNIVSFEAPNNPDEEEAYLQEAIRQSLEKSGRGTKDRASSSGGDLLDFAPAVRALPPASSYPFSAATPGSGPYVNTTQLALPSSTNTPATDPWGGAAGSYPAGSSGLLALPSSSGGYDYGSSLVPQQQPYKPSSSWSASVEAVPPPAPSDSWGAPAPVYTQQPYGQAIGTEAVPSAVSPHAQQTPSSLGFNSPYPDFSGFSPAPPQAAPVQTDFSGFSPAPPQAAPVQTTVYAFADSELPVTSNVMNEIGSKPESGGDRDPSRHGGSPLDQAFSKLVNLDTFSFSATTKEENGVNPFVGGTQSLQDLKKMKSVPPKEIMKPTAPAPGAMVVSMNQNGAYGSQYGVQAGYGASAYGVAQSQMPQAAPAGYGNPPYGYGMAPHQASPAQGPFQVPQPSLFQQQPPQPPATQQQGQPQQGYYW